MRNLRTDCSRDTPLFSSDTLPVLEDRPAGLWLEGVRARAAEEAVSLAPCVRVEVWWDREALDEKDGERPEKPELPASSGPEEFEASSS
ncbi:hypothetical protein HYQ46_001775 [Verticillium longisporum]|nr:hypothetical protein HYQ46_001775 [Verticillium longisporum]